VVAKAPGIIASPGRVSTLNDPGGVNLAFTYDGPLPLSETWSGPVAGSVSRTFSNNFDLATESVNGAQAVTFDYDDDRLLTAAGALTITRDATNGLATATTMGSTTETHQHNTFGEPTRQSAQFNATQLFDVQMTRDNLGRITQRIETFPEITRTYQYGYDLAGRLLTVTRDGLSGPVTVAAYTYDGNGNRLTAESEAYGGGAPITATYDNQDRLLTYGNANYTYTANGELATKTVSGQTTSYVYDTLGNLIQVTLPNADVITYIIDGRGRRVGKSINGTRVKGWLYADQLRPIAELDGNGTLVSRFVYGTKPNIPNYIIKNGTTYRVFSDHLGSPRVIVDAATGVVVQRMDFQAFGEILQDSNPGWQPFGFAGGLYDLDTPGLVRFGRRDYDSSIGRWLSKDGMKAIGAEPNRYSYATQDPINLIDQTGQFPWAALVVGAAFEVAGQAYQNYAAEKDVFDYHNYSGWDIAVASGINVVAPSVMEIGKTILKAPGAIATISRQLETAVSAVRRAKLEQRLAKYTSGLADSVSFAAGYQFIEAFLKNWDPTDADFSSLDAATLAAMLGGTYCPINQK
jgi:RHS repeat-associated protein